MKTNGYHTPHIGPHDSCIQKPNGLTQSDVVSSNGKPHLLVFSAHSDVSLQKMIPKYQEFVREQSPNFTDFAYTLNVRRIHGSVRSFCVSDGITIEASPAVKHAKPKGLLWIFTGQGSQWAGMGRELLRDFPTFQEDIRQLDVWLTEASHPPSWKIEGMLSPASSWDFF